MKKCLRALCITLVSGSGLGWSAEPLRPAVAGAVECGGDDTGFFVRVRGGDSGRALPKGTAIEEVCDFLATASGLKVLYAISDSTRVTVGPEWRGSSPEQVLNSFLGDVGLRAVRNRDVALIVGPWNTDLRLEVVDTTPARQRMSRDDVWAMLATSLTARRIPCNCDALLRVRTAAVTGLPGSFFLEAWFHDSTTPIGVKLRVTKHGSGFKRDWEVSSAGERLETGEDFDGDGIKDLILTEDPESGPNRLVSAKSGTTLLSFYGLALAVGGPRGNTARIGALSREDGGLRAVVFQRSNDSDLSTWQQAPEAGAKRQARVEVEDYLVARRLSPLSPEGGRVYLLPGSRLEGLTEPGFEVIRLGEDVRGTPSPSALEGDRSLAVFDLRPTLEERSDRR